MTKPRPIAPGTRFRLTGRYLRSTGQITGPEGLSRWVAQACDCGLCRGGRFVCSNEPRYDGEGLRHFARPNVEPVRK